MITRQVGSAFMFDQMAPRLLDALQPEHLFHRQAAQEQNEFWVQQFDLLKKIKRSAGLNLFDFGGAVGGRTAFDDVRNEKIRPLQPGALQDMLEIAPGVSNE